MSEPMTVEEMSESDAHLGWVLDAHSESLNDIGEQCAICCTLMPCNTAILAASGLHRSARIAALEAENAALRAAGDAMHDAGKALRTYIVRDKTRKLRGHAWFDNLEAGLAASTALADGMKAWRASQHGGPRGGAR